MNVADTEIVQGLLTNKGYDLTTDIKKADVVLLNTCSIRENAEQRIYGRLGNIKTLKYDNPNLVIGILGCMATNFREKLLEDPNLGIDFVAGPDSYRKLPELIKNIEKEKGNKAFGKVGDCRITR